MMRVNLIAPKADPTALPGRFILPLWKETKAHFLVLQLIEMHSDSRYSVKKVVKFAVEN